MAKKAEFVRLIYKAAIEAGLTDPAARVMAAQAAHESQFGERAPGYNYFGIKAGSGWDGDTQRLTTHEVENGKRVKTKADFRAYDTPEAAIADRIAFMADKFPAFNGAETVGEALDALQAGKFGKYYTDSRDAYERSINTINTRYLGGTPVPPGSIPDSDVASEISISSGLLRKGDNSGDVGTLQDSLRKRGFDPGATDNDFGNRTEAAVRAFQKAHGLVEDGIVGPKTRAALEGYGVAQDGRSSAGAAGTDLLDMLRSRAAGLPLSAVGVRAPNSSYKPGDQMAPATDEELAGLTLDDRLMTMTAPRAATMDPVGDGPSYDLLDILRTRAETKGIGGMGGMAGGAGGAPPVAHVVPPLPNRGIGFDPLPAPAPLVAPDGPSVAPGPPVVAPPMPMPGRPASISTVPQSPPAQRKAAEPEARSDPAPKMVRLPTGKMAPVGTQVNPETGNTITVVDLGNGQGKIEIQRKGLIDIGSEMNAPTLAGSLIRSKIAEVVPQAVETAASNFAPAVEATKTAATQAIDQVAPVVEGLKTGASDVIGNLFSMFGGGKATSAPVTSAPEFQPGMMGRGQPTAPRRPAVVAPTPRPMPAQYLRGSSGRQAYEIGRTYRTSLGDLVVATPSGLQPIGQPQRVAVSAPPRARDSRWDGVLDSFGNII